MQIKSSQVLKEDCRLRCVMKAKRELPLKKEVTNGGYIIPP
jgi:hypothetical protein